MHRASTSKHDKTEDMFHYQGIAQIDLQRTESGEFLSTVVVHIIQQSILNLLQHICRHIVHTHLHTI